MAASHKPPHPSWKKGNVAKDLSPAVGQGLGEAVGAQASYPKSVSLPTQTLLTPPQSPLDPPDVENNWTASPTKPMELCLSSGPVCIPEK